VMFLGDGGAATTQCRLVDGRFGRALALYSGGEE